MKARFLAFALFLAFPILSSFGQVGISINIAPPLLPIVAQPPCPVEGYIWNPGYWAYGNVGYYWVPGVWVPPPQVGFLWTPPYWGFNNGAYVFNEGYWGPTVGFYGGINYGYGYFGNGYWGGRWEGNVFRYNTAVTRVNTTVIHNTFVDRSVLRKQVRANRASFNGPNGVKAQPTAEQRAAAENARKMAPTQQQLARREAASKDRNLQASVNHGRPKPEAIRSFQRNEQPGRGSEGRQAANQRAENRGETADRRERENGARDESRRAEESQARERGKRAERGRMAENREEARNQERREESRAAENRNERPNGERWQPGAGLRRIGENARERRQMAERSRAEARAREEQARRGGQREEQNPRKRRRKAEPPPEGR